MEKKTLITDSIIVAAVILIAIVLFLWWGDKSRNVVPSVRDTTGVKTSAEEEKSRTSAPLTAPVHVPDENDSSVPANVAVPEIVSPAASGREEKSRVFEITIANNKFSPDTVISRMGDVVKIKFTAVDKDYDVVQPDYGVSLSVPKTETKQMQFGVTIAGKFTIYCPSCGGPEKGPIGYVIVSP